MEYVISAIMVPICAVLGLKSPRILGKHLSAISALVTPGLIQYWLVRGELVSRESWPIVVGATVGLVLGRLYSVIGLTGGIACGKSTVVNTIQEEFGGKIAIIDCDKIARVIVEPGRSAYK
jgi:hypothetical protein